ncbi:tetratricopeptide repeat protein [Prochlorococcus marinus]|uniref:tetratricopeptide repeat protein n=1 Tax=Prochlorococcus marinus TaxID=1219 RepID=UPI0022B5ACD7|nr:tetratricopeptide repeat protein [Prochlorococcus marinus]
MEGKRSRDQAEFKVKTFPVPISLGVIKEKSSKNDKLNQEELINQSINIHIQGNIKEATKYYKYLIDQGVNDYRVFSNLGNILKGLGNLDEAELYTRKAIEINPNEASILFNLGNILKDLGNLEEAELYTLKSIKIKPDLAKAHFCLGLISNRQGDPYKAIEAFKKTIKFSPDNLDAILSLGSTLIDIRKNEEGKKYLMNILDIKPNKDINKERINLLNTIQQKALYKLTHCLFHEGDFTSSRELLGKLTVDEYYYSYNIACLLGLDTTKDFYNAYKIISEKNICNSIIGSVIDHSNIIYGEKNNSTFCNEAIDYIMHKNLNEEEFPTNMCDSLISFLHQDNNKAKVRNGLNNISQTKGNIFSLDYTFIKDLKKLIENQINNYRHLFRDSKEGFIKNWPENYSLGGWLLDTKPGGLLKPHMHEGAWLSGSFYLKVPKKNNDEGNIVFSPKGPLYPDKGKLFPEKVLTIKSRDICIFPSSLFHYTIPFKSSEERICFVFDIMPF